MHLLNVLRASCRFLIHMGLDTLGIEPRTSRMLSGCDTTTPRAHGQLEDILRVTWMCS